MRKLLFILLIFITFAGQAALSFHAQVSVQSRVDSLLRQAKPILETHPDKAFKILEEALRMAEEGDLQKSRANTLNYMGIIHYNQQAYSDAVKYFQRSLKILFRLGNKEKVANMMKKIGLSYLNQEKYTKAIEYYNFALKIFDQIQHLGRKAETHVEVGVIYRLAKRYSEAIDEINNAFELYEELGNKAGQAKTLHHQAKTYHEMGNMKKADEFYQLTIELYEKYLDYGRLAAVLNNYGRTLIDMKKYNQAQKVMKQAEKYCDEKESLLYGKIVANYGAVLVYKSEFEQARNNLNIALKIAKQFNNEDLKAQVYRMLYELNFRNNDTRQALTYYQKYIAVKDTTSGNRLKQYTSEKGGVKLSNLIVFITVFGSLIIIGLIIWLVIVIRQRDRALDELRKIRYPEDSSRKLQL